MVFQAFETEDGEIVIGAGNDRLFAKLAVVLGRPEWNEDPRFKTNPSRVRHRDVLLPEIEAIIRTRPRAAWQSLLEAAGVPCAPVNSFAELTRDPQLAAIEIMEKVPGVDLEVVGLPLSFDGRRPKIRRRAPSIGEHNAEIVGDAISGR
jgi:crotonobetainyl-CoA:carnitine CoA-transferase CaiB-like acyl-CoA transferase